VIPEDILAAIEAADYVVGSDEVGYGSWAGPLVVCAVVLSKDWPLAHLVKDSKAFTGKNAAPNRERIARQILKTVTYAMVSVVPAEIDQKGVGKVLPASHGKAIDAVIAKHEAMGVIGTNAVIVDGNLKILYGEGKTAYSLPKADALIPAVSAASILGKVARDAYMRKIAALYPGYGFEDHMGYGGDDTHQHTIALKKLGICEIHRKSYAPMRDMIRQQQPDFDLSVFEAKE
jgi:ribonuclease HII